MSVRGNLLFPGKGRGRRGRIPTLGFPTKGIVSSLDNILLYYII